MCMVRSRRGWHIRNALHSSAKSAAQRGLTRCHSDRQGPKDIIDNSRDNVASPYVVHRLLEKRSNPISKEVNHPTQVAPDYLSRAFSELRDRIGVAAELPIKERPTFHEIRALAAHIFERQGIDPQARMAHSDAKSTKIYTQNHVEWVEVPHAEIKMA